MNRRWRRLLASGLVGAALSLMMGRGRKRVKTASRNPFMTWVRPFLLSLVGGMSKEGLWGKLLPLRRRIR
ncbi:MAG: hypothetical protein GX202_06245 [Firmicutes bacterium]|nr:hypothetical protein [Bacillota bacterium]